jgi:general secretion pathway protein C
MDVAKRLAEWRDQPPEQWLGAANRYLPPGVTAVLVLAIAYQLAMLTWSLAGSVSVESAPPIPLSGPASPVTKGSSDFGILSGSHLFGEAPKQAAAPVLPAVVDAPETTLNLTLTGILYNDDNTGQAIIAANRSQEKTYKVGQTIDNANGATLHSVLADRVLLNLGDHLETLRLPKETTAGRAAGRAPSPLVAPAAASPANESLRQVITQNASRITDVMRIQPQVDGGKIVGFRVQPGRDSASFQALGLKAGDVITDINGTTLNDATAGLKVFESLGEATQANVTVLRDGAPQVLVVDTSQLQRLQENRE